MYIKCVLPNSFLVSAILKNKVVRALQIDNCKKGMSRARIELATSRYQLRAKRDHIMRPT